MKKALGYTGKAIAVTGKVLLAGLLLVGTFIMNCVGALICAIDR